MKPAFEELDYRPTPIGALSLRRRFDPRLGGDVFEIKLGDEFLMSSWFTASEIALARLALTALEADGATREASLDVAVGGLGMGYTALAALEHASVGALLVIEFLEPVIDWHRQELLPPSAALMADPRTRIAEGDFFALAASEDGLDPTSPGRLFHTILLDIDHSPEALLDARSASFYAPAGLARCARRLRQGGLFGLWSNDTPDPAFTERLAGVFGEAWAEPVTFHNPLQDKPFTQTVYLARRTARPEAP